MVKSVILGIDPSEKVLFEVKRHPIGIYAIVAVASFLLAFTFLLLFIAVRSGFELVFFPGAIGLGIFFFALAAMIVIIANIASSIYSLNELIVTEQNIIQILQQSLFDRKVSQLNLAKIQDVSVDQEGLLSTILGYGTITIETAGEASNYIFRYAPQPNVIAKRINEAHELYLENATGSTSQDGV